MKKKVILLVNLGTPDKPTIFSVAKYLFQFLNDKYIIDIPWLFRFLLVNLIIVPFRTPKSTRLYRELWTEKGSPLLYHLQSLTQKLQSQMSENYHVACAMRYGNPSVKSVLKKIKNIDIDEVIIVPMYPQYATSTTESSKQHIIQAFKKEKMEVNLRFINQFYDQSEFIDTFSEQVQKYEPEKYDHVLFSYHGVPTRQIHKLHPDKQLSGCVCEEKLADYGKLCYKATCFETTRLMANKLSLKRDKYDVVFQSHLSDDWLQPFFDIRLMVLLKLGKKRILVISPSFIADCLETKVEIEKKYSNMFIKSGGEELKLVEGLNDNDLWVEALHKIIVKFSNNIKP